MPQLYSGGFVILVPRKSCGSFDGRWDEARPFPSLRTSSGSNDELQSSRLRAARTTCKSSSIKPASPTRRRPFKFWPCFVVIESYHDPRNDSNGSQGVRWNTNVEFPLWVVLTFADCWSRKTEANQSLERRAVLSTRSAGYR